MSKYEFAGVEWMNALHREIAAMAKDADPALRYHFCEVFTGVPKHLDRNGTGVLSWNCRIEGSRVFFAETEANDVDLKTIGDYDYLVPLAHWLVDDETRVAFNAYLQEGMQSGKLKQTGDPARFPAVLVGLHNAVIAFTA